MQDCLESLLEKELKELGIHLTRRITRDERILELQIENILNRESKLRKGVESLYSSVPHFLPEYERKANYKGLEISFQRREGPTTPSQTIDICSEDRHGVIITSMIYLNKLHISAGFIAGEDIGWDLTRIKLESLADSIGEKTYHSNYPYEKELVGEIISFLREIR